MFDAVLRVVSLVVSLLVSWLLFTWMIARLPRETVSFGAVDAGRADRGGRIRDFQTGGRRSTCSRCCTVPAGATFGPVLGLMVFAYITARLLSFATAWAATAKDNLHERSEEPSRRPRPRSSTPG